MSDIFERLERLVRSVLAGDDPEFKIGAMRDPDVQDAWDELESFLEPDAPPRNATGGDGRATGRASAAAVPQELWRDYSNLEIPLSADLTATTAAFKRLMGKYHPDRFATDAKKQTIATEIAQKLTESFGRIRNWLAKGIRPAS